MNLFRFLEAKNSIKSPINKGFLKKKIHNLFFNSNFNILILKNNSNFFISSLINSIRDTSTFRNDLHSQKFDSDVIKYFSECDKI